MNLDQSIKWAGVLAGVLACGSVHASGLSLAQTPQVDYRIVYEQKEPAAKEPSRMIFMEKGPVLYVEKRQGPKVSWMWRHEKGRTLSVISGSTAAWEPGANFAAQSGRLFLPFNFRNADPYLRKGDLAAALTEKQRDAMRGADGEVVLSVSGNRGERVTAMGLYITSVPKTDLPLRLAVGGDGMVMTESVYSSWRSVAGLQAPGEILAAGYPGFMDPSLAGKSGRQVWTLVEMKTGGGFVIPTQEEMLRDGMVVSCSDGVHATGVVFQRAAGSLGSQFHKQVAVHGSRIRVPSPMSLDGEEFWLRAGAILGGGLGASVLAWWIAGKWRNRNVKA